GVPVYILLLVGTISLPFTTFLVPACSGFAALLVDLMIMGWCMGCVDCIANLRMLTRFGANVSPFLQAMHFCYGLGAFISPMIAAPFILNVDCTDYIDGKHVSPAPGNFSEDETVAPPQPQKITRAQHLSHSEIAFFILGTIQFVIASVVVVVIILEKKNIIGYGASISQASSAHSFVSMTSDKEIRDISGQKTCFFCGTREILVITILTSASLFLYDGLQSSFADYIYSYAEKNGLRKRGEGAILNACFWGLFAFGRLIAIPAATRLTPAFMLSCNLTGSVVSVVITLLFRGQIVAIYAGSCMLGLFLSSMSPTVMSMTEQFININPSIASCLVVCAALGETLCPVIVGNLFVALGPPSFLIFCTALCIIAAVLYTFLYLIGQKTTKYRESSSASFIWLDRAENATKHIGENALIKDSTLRYYSSGTEPGAEPEAHLDTT
ncbi:hypothetical protein FSP39_006777, partial [Pinctada imbricata]